MVRAAFFALTALVVAPSAHAAWWTLPQARKIVLRETFTETDAAQADRPTFTFKLERATVAGVGKPRVVKKVKRWQRFSVNGTANDEASGQSIAVGFMLRPTGTTDYAVSGFRGPPPDTTQPSFPIRAPFFYPWFPEGWNQEGLDPFTVYHPVLGRYDSGDAAVIRAQIKAMQYGGFTAAIASWWGQGASTDTRLPLLLAAARQTPFRFAVYYEHEGYANPAVDEIRNDLHYLHDHYFDKPAYLKVGGKPVVFVYAPGDRQCDLASRWHAANDVGAYVDLETAPVGLHQVAAFTPFAPSMTGGVRVAAGDVTGDGKTDIVAAAGSDSEPRVSVLDLSSGAVISSFLAGSATSGVNVAADRGEIVTGVGPTVALWTSGGTLLRSVDSGFANVRVAVGDVDGDGRNEILAAGGSTVRILDGATLATRADLAPFAGATVSGVAAGDVDGDGKAEIVAASGFGRQDEVRVIRADGSLVGSFTAYPGDTGGLRVAAGDLDGDGLADIVTGPAVGAPDIHSYSLNGSGFYQNPPAGFYAFGAAVCPCPFDPSFAGGVSVAVANRGAGALAELVTGVGFGHAPEVRTFGHFDSCADQPDGWHYYGLPPDGDLDMRGGGSYTIVPGFWRAGDAAARVPRDPDRWRLNVRTMVASKENWQLVISFNEWGEGTAVEAAQEWASPSGFGTYLDALHANGAE